MPDTSLQVRPMTRILKFRLTAFAIALLLNVHAFAQTLPEHVKLVSKGAVIHRFFDTSPLSPSGKYMALFRFPYENKSPTAGDEGEVIVVDIKTGKERVVAKSKGWEMQLGANVQWGKTDKELYYNEVDTATWEAFALCINPFTLEKKRMASTVFMASQDGKKLATYNLINSIYAQVGYGVIVPKDKAARNIGPVDTDGINVTDVASNITERIVTIKDIYEKAVPSIQIDNPQDYEYYCFQVKWNPQGTRLLTTVQWSPINGGDRRRAVITMRPDGSDIRTAVTPDQWARGGHHINWAADGDHLTMNLNIEGKPGIEIVRFKYDGSEMENLYQPGSGHPSANPNGSEFIVTDAYAGEMPVAGDYSPIRLINIKTHTEQLVAAVALPPIADMEFRVDAHPAWDRKGRYVIYNGTVDGTRSVFIADVKKMMKGK